MELLEINNTISEMKHTLDKIKRRFDTAERKKNSMILKTDRNYPK